MKVEIEEYVVDAWVALLRAKDNSLEHIEAELKRNGLPPFAWYDVLWELDKVGDAGLRPFEIEQRKLLTQYSLSRLLGRLEKQGYIIKQACSEDGRGHRAIITPEGSKIRREMWLVYSAGIQATIGEHLDEAQCRQVRQILEPLMGVYGGNIDQ